MRSAASTMRGVAIFGCGLAALSVLLATPAAANWQYTQWGMSPEAVKAASDGTAVDNGDRGLDAEGLTAQLTAPYQGSTLPFMAVFMFGIRDGLKVVTLSPRNRDTCAQVPAILKAHYGAPLSSKVVDKSTTARWNDYGNNNVVNFLDLGGGNCSIEYTKLLNTRNDGTL